jgi:hypothetical protein
VSESHEALAAIEFGADDRFGALRCGDVEHHVERRTGCAAMQRALECTDRAGNRRDDIGLCRNNDSRGKGGGVETVVAHRIQIGLHGPGSFGRWLGAGKLMEVMSGVRQIGADRDGGFTAADPPVRSHDRRKGCDRGHRVAVRVLLASEAEKGRRHSQRIHRRTLCRRGFV